jgi:glycosyltransferase involved in cell wall biosynthesis
MAEEKPRQIIISMPDRAGGLPNVIRNILIYRRCKDFRFHLFLIDESGYQGLRVYEDIPADSITRFIYDRDDNLYHVCRRVGRKLKSFGPEALLVSNSEFDLHMATVCRLNNPILHICHGDNRLIYKTAESYKPIVNHYVAVSRYIADQLASTAGIRPGRISYIPHPIAFSSYTRMPSENNLRIVFVGRLVKGKGIFLMPEIDAQLRRRQVPVEWISLISRFRIRIFRFHLLIQGLLIFPARIRRAGSR